MEGAAYTTEDEAGVPCRPRVLVVDADEAVLTLLKMTLPAYGLEVVTARGLSDAAEAHRRRPGEFALALLGANGQEGLKTWEVLRKLQPNLRTVFMTGGLGNAMKDRLAELAPWPGL